MSATEQEIRLSLGTVRYRVRRSSRARKLSLRFHPADGFEVVLPQRTPLREVEPFLRSMEGWIAQVLAKQRRTLPAAPIPLGLNDGAVVPFLDTRPTLRIEGVAGDGRSTIQLDNHGGVLQARIALDNPVAIEELVESWYRYAARTLLPEHVDCYAAELGVQRGRIAIKDTRSRWGSCSSKGNLNFSWRLLLAPEAVMRYVVAHEVAHLMELNHSPRFWATVARLDPHYAQHRAWLQRHGQWLAAWPYGLVHVRTE